MLRKASARQGLACKGCSAGKDYEKTPLRESVADNIFHLFFTPLTSIYSMYMFVGRGLFLLGTKEIFQAAYPVR
ncbi:hypothetical protein GCM10023310_08520 [Paenibacillus vulneris]